jgi:hypothetical protein
MGGQEVAMLGRISRVVAACTVALGAVAPAFAGEKHVPGSYSTIQAAVDAAAEGDVVICAAGTYTEAVAATKSKITIQGASGAVWDGGTGASAKDCVTLTGDANVVTGFAFKNGNNHCKLVGDDVKVKNCTSADAAVSFVVVTGARAFVDNCRVDRPKGPAFKCRGNSPTFKYCKVYDCDDVAFDCEGDDAWWRSCWVERCKKGGYKCKGKYQDVRGCDARSCDDFGFKIEGDFAYCFDNYAKECGTSVGNGGSGGGYVCVGSDNYFEYCDTYKCKPAGHKCKGNRNWHYDNWCDDSEEDGFRSEGDDNDNDYGQARNNGRDGFSCEGDRNDHYGCDSNDNRDDGYDTRGGTDNSYRYCDAKGNDGAGCENGGSSTDCSSCVFLYNTVDVGLSVSGATFGTFSFNTFLSGSVTGILRIGLGL